MHVTDSLAPGGKERMLVDLANLSTRDGHAVSVCVTRGDTSLASDLLPGIDLHVLGRRHRHDWAPLLRLVRAAREGRVELFHSHGRSSFSLLAILQAMGLLHGAVLLHDHNGGLGSQTVPAWFRWARRWLSLYVGVSEELAQWAVRAGIDTERVRVIENALDLSRIERATPGAGTLSLGAPPEGPTGVIVGSVQLTKGLDVLIEALACVDKELPVRLLVVGGVADPAFALTCQGLVRRRGLEGSILFLGQRPDALGLLKGADFLVCASRAESGPLVLIEAMAAGVPFVSTRVGAVGERLAVMGLHEFVEPGRADVLAAALERLLRLSVDERRARGERGRELARRLFDLHPVMARWYQAYGDALLA